MTMSSNFFLKKLKIYVANWNSCLHLATYFQNIIYYSFINTIVYLKISILIKHEK